MTISPNGAVAADEPIEVSVWEPSQPGVAAGTWSLVGGASYTRLEVEPRHADVGVWSMTLPRTSTLGAPGFSQADAITAPRIVTTLFRGDLRSWVIDPRTVTAADDGHLSVTVGGFDALAVLGWVVAWPAPAAAITAQPAQAVYTGTAAQVIAALVTAEARRTGLALDVDPPPAPAASDPQVPSRPRFDNALTEVLRVAKRGGIGVRVGLAPTVGATRARLRLSFYTPRDRTVRVRLAAAEGSLSSWELTESAPTATRAVVGGLGEGSGQYLRVVTTPDSVAQAVEWGGHREVFVEGPDTFDDTVLDEAGRDALAEGAATASLTMEAQEPAGTKAFQAFLPGDRVTAVPLPGVEIADVVTAVRVVHETRGVPAVTPIFGDPDPDDPDARAARLIRALRRDVAAMKTTRKRGAT